MLVHVHMGVVVQSITIVYAPSTIHLTLAYLVFWFRCVPAFPGSRTATVQASGGAQNHKQYSIDWGFRNCFFSGVTESFLNPVVKLDEVTNSFLKIRNCRGGALYKRKKLRRPACGGAEAFSDGKGRGEARGTAVSSARARGIKCYVTFSDGTYAACPILESEPRSRSCALP